MNRRDFLKVVTATAAVVATPSFIPADAKFVPGEQITIIYTDGIPTSRVIGGIEREITRHPDRGAYFVCYQGKINNANHYVGDFVEANPPNCSKALDEETLRVCDENAMKAFKRRAYTIHRIESWKARKLTKAELLGDFPPYGV